VVVGGLVAGGLVAGGLVAGGLVAGGAGTVAAGAVEAVPPPRIVPPGAGVVDGGFAAVVVDAPLATVAGVEVEVEVGVVVDGDDRRTPFDVTTKKVVPTPSPLAWPGRISPV
jgi:hypothetical protein